MSGDRSESVGHFSNQFLSATTFRHGSRPTGNLLVGSYYTHELLEYSGTTGAFLLPFVPEGSGGLTFPSGLAFGPDGDLFVLGTFNSHATTGAFVTGFVPPGSGGLNVPTVLTFGPIPEPSTLSLLGIGASLAAWGWRRRQLAAG